MSATTPAPAATTLTWAEAPREYRRGAYAAAATKSLVPLLGVAALSLALATDRTDLAAWIGPIGMVAFTALTMASNLKSRRTAQMVLPSEHKVSFPRALGSASAITAIASHVAFAGLLLASDAPLAAPYAIFVGVITSAPAWSVVYEKVEGRKLWVAALSSAATLATLTAWAPDHLPAALAWMIGTPLLSSALLFVGGALDGELKVSELRPWTRRPFEALTRHFTRITA